MIICNKMLSNGIICPKLICFSKAYLGKGRFLLKEKALSE